MDFYKASIDQIINILSTHVTHGLSAQESANRIHTYGANVLPDRGGHSWVSLFLNQFRNPLIYILLIAACLIFVVSDDPLDAFIISGVLFFNAIIGTIQEGRTHNIIESLKRFIKTTCIVIRDGVEQLVEDSQLVPGDLIVLQEGQRIPADARVVLSHHVAVDESALTGESVPVDKEVAALSGDLPLHGRKNMVYTGTYVVSGSGKAIVVATGINTQIGAIHKNIVEISTDIPLRKELDRLSYVILIAIFALCFILFGVGLAMGKPFAELLSMLTALFICVVPEGLPVVLTLVLVTGAYRMAQQKVFVKNLQGVEALGRADVIVTDKTGTLTRNEMMVCNVFADGVMCSVTGQGYHEEGTLVCADARTPILSRSDLYQIGIAASLLNTTQLIYQKALDIFTIKGDPTEAALYVFSKKMNISKDELEKQYIKEYELPFSPQTKMHAAFFKVRAGGAVAYVIGAPEQVMSRCLPTHAASDTHLKELLDKGLRVIAIATKNYEAPHGDVSHDRLFHEALMRSDLHLLGLVGIQDSIRHDVAESIARARHAGLSIIMATGDHQKTAQYVAHATGIYAKGDVGIDGSELDHKTDEQIAHSLDEVTVYSRLSPNQKLRIIRLLQTCGKTVAMTGDGINDAPSLVAADLGIAMGGIGTEVAKAAADMVLLDDSFVHIIGAIEEGRHIFYTLRKVILYFFATNMGEVLIVLFALIAGLPLPITAGQILWLNLVTDGFLDVGLSMEPKEEGLLSKAWLSQDWHLVDRFLLLKMMYMAIPMGVGSLCVFLYYSTTDLAHARTMTLVTMAMYQWFNAWNCRSETKSVFKIGIFSNKWLLAAISIVLGLQFLLLYNPAMRFIFKTVPLTGHDWLVIVMITLPMLIIEELRKWGMRTVRARRLVD